MDPKRSIRKKQRRKMQVVFTLALLILILLLGLLFAGLYTLQKHKPEWFDFRPSPTVGTDVEETEAEETEEPETPEETEAESETEEAGAVPGELTEQEIYTFLQGPKSWKMKKDWSGTWNDVVYADQEFSIFGCGLCDMANIYSSLTPYDCSPLDMLAYAEEVTDYHPVSGFGAIDWRYMRQTLKKTGITSRLRKKDKTYEQFQQAIAGGLTAIVLVCSGNDDTYWHDVEGHYVNIWLYNADDDTVFLADSGNPDHNRQRIPLRYIYDALKTSDKYQYMLVTDVNVDANAWQHNGINMKWKKPRYYNSMKDRWKQKG